MKSEKRHHCPILDALTSEGLCKIVYARTDAPEFCHEWILILPEWKHWDENASHALDAPDVMAYMNRLDGIFFCPLCGTSLQDAEGG